MNYNILKKFSRSVRWQTIYARVKEIGSLQLFNNTSDLTKLQLLVMQWTEIYHSLYEDIAMNKPYIDEKIIEDELRTEAYLLWRRKNQNKDVDSQIKQSKDNQKSNNNSGRPSMIFTRRGKKK